MRLIPHQELSFIDASPGVKLTSASAPTKEVTLRTTSRSLDSDMDLSLSTAAALPATTASRTFTSQATTQFVKIRYRLITTEIVASDYFSIAVTSEDGTDTSIGGSVLKLPFYLYYRKVGPPCG